MKNEKKKKRKKEKKRRRNKRGPKESMIYVMKPSGKAALIPFPPSTMLQNKIST